MPLNLFVGLGLVIFALYLRIHFHLGRSPGGVDAYYYLSYVRELRQKKKFPPKLPQYLMDIEEQWYPPIFPCLLCFIPFKVLDRYHWLISPIIDCIQLFLLYLFTLTITNSLVCGVIAGSIYALIPTLTFENRNLTSRSLGSLFYILTILSCFQYIETTKWIWLLLFIITGFSLLLTHKLATQCFIFTMLFLGTIETNLTYILLFLGLIIATFILSFGFYWKILLGHIDILLFWRRNLHNLGAHQILDSPLYSQYKSTTKTRFFFPGWHNIIKHLEKLLGHNPFLIPLLTIPFFNSDIDRFYWWAISVYLLAFATTFIPALRFLGEGYKYIKLSAFPCAYILTKEIITNQMYFLFMGIITIAVAVLNLWIIIRTCKIISRKAVSHHVLHSITDSLKEVSFFLNELPKDVILCLPLSYADYIVYFTNKKVLWGTHSAGFKKIEGFFPVLQKPLDNFIDKYDVGYILLDTNYVKPEIINLPNEKIRIKKEIKPFIIYEVV